MARLQLKNPVELFVLRREFLPGSAFLSRRDMTSAVESDVKPYSFLLQNLATITRDYRRWLWRGRMQDFITGNVHIGYRRPDSTCGVSPTPANCDSAVLPV